ncbi:MAG: FecR family protein [Tannerellaceae bacterium]|nr:FecR family protein [Tannerellaceae bacterium]
MGNNQPIELLERFLQGIATEEEVNLLKEQISDPATREICYSYYYRCWQQAANYMDPSLQQDILEELMKQIEEPQEPAISGGKKNFRLKSWLSYAAAACLLMVIGTTVFYTFLNPAGENGQVVLAVKNAQKAEVTLADGTVVYINSDSRLIYDESYNRNDRVITLEGEAYFEVSQNKDKLFVVQANGIRIEALGTSFNIKAHLNDPVVSVILIDGKVRVCDEDNQEQFMKPNDWLEYNRVSKDYQRFELPPNANHLLWRNDELVFAGDSLEEICRTLTRMYNVEFIFNNEEIKKLTFRGVIKNNSLTNVLEFLSQTSSVTYKINPDSTIIMEKR